MCAVSVIMQYGIDHPGWQKEEDGRRAMEIAIEAAEIFDRVTGQDGCEKPELIREFEDMLYGQQSE